MPISLSNLAAKTNKRSLYKRIDKRNIKKDRFEKDIGKNIEVYNETVEYLNTQGWSIKKLDATQKPQELLQDLLSRI